jgi:hypothetical protein
MGLEIGIFQVNAMLNPRVGRRILAAKTTMDRPWSLLRAAWRGRTPSINCPALGDEWLVLDTVNILEYARGAELICDIGDGSPEPRGSGIIRCIEFALDHTGDGDRRVASYFTKGKTIRGVQSIALQGSLQRLRPFCEQRVRWRAQRPAHDVRQRLLDGARVEKTTCRSAGRRSVRGAVRVTGRGRQSSQCGADTRRRW